MASHLSFLDLPAPIRHRIYTYLLAPHANNSETVINYELRWTWLANPSNTTFAGIPQIDLCRCPRQKPWVKNVKTRDHMYMRYKCHGPDVIFKPGRENLWVPSSQYKHSGQINFLRPAGEDELRRRPNANILSTCKTVYEEALPALYRGRNFLFVSGVCPRGRYQAYATLRFFAGLSVFARAHVTAFSLIAVAHEEDCRTEDVRKAYGELAIWVWRNLPSFESLGIALWDARLTGAIKRFEMLLEKDGVTIELDRGQKDDGWVEEIGKVERFRSALVGSRPEGKNIREGPLWQKVGADTMSDYGEEVEVSPKPGDIVREIAW